MGRPLAIDYGRKRIGLATADPLGLAVRPLPVLERRDPDDPRDALDALVALCREEEIEELVIGLPLRLDGTEGPAVAEVREFARQLAERTGLEVVECDERMTTGQSHAMLKSGGVRHRQRKGRVDSTAAVLLLQSHLARRRRS